MVKMKCPRCGKVVEVPDDIVDSGEKCYPCNCPLQIADPVEAEKRGTAKNLRAELWTFLGILTLFVLLGILASYRPSAEEIFRDTANQLQHGVDPKVIKRKEGFFTYDKMIKGAAGGLLAGLICGGLGAGLVYVIRKDRTANRLRNRQPYLAWSMALLITGLHVGAFFLPTIEQRPRVYVDAGGAQKELPDPLYRRETVELKEPKVYYGRLEPNFATTESVCFLFPLWLGVLLLVLQSWRGALITGIIAGIMVLVHYVGVAVTVNYVPFKLLYGYYVWYTSVLLLPVAALIGLCRR